jgi:hypothetical protein
MSAYHIALGRLKGNLIAVDAMLPAMGGILKLILWTVIVCSGQELRSRRRS